MASQTPSHEADGPQQESLAITLPGAPPGEHCPEDDARRSTLLDLAKRTTTQPPNKEPVGVSIRYVRGQCQATPLEVIGGIVEVLRGVLFEREAQILELCYSERPGEKEHYQLSVSPLGFQIPILFEPQGELGILKADPAVFFPDDAASRWMLGLLLANQDIGATMKILFTYLGTPKNSVESHAQYRTSHMLYFWRLWLAHIHEAWLAFNQARDNALVQGVKDAPEVAQIWRRVSDLRGKSVVGELSAADLLEKCRHTAFHYGERDGDTWAEQLRKLSDDFHVCITHGDCKDVDSRWLIADEYLVSRLNPLEFGNRDMHATMRDIALETMALIRFAQKFYFNQRQPGFIQ